MNLHEEIAKVAYQLYEKSGCVTGREIENWLDAESIVLARHASQEIEEPEGEEAIIANEEIIEEIEGTKTMYARKQKEDHPTVVHEIDVRSPAIGTKEDLAIRTEKIRPAKPTVAKGKKLSPKKTRQKSREKYH